MIKQKIINLLISMLCVNILNAQITPHTIVPSDLSSNDKLIYKPSGEPRQTSTLDKRKRPKVHALVVGISDYKSISDLNYADKDAIKMYNFLKSSEGGAVKEIKLLLNSKATREQIIANLLGFASYATTNDLIIFYFSGHGGENGSFCPYDQSTKTTITYADIAGCMGGSRAKYKLCVVDACFSGGLTTLNPNQRIPLRSTEETYYSNLEASIGGTALFMSSRQNETSQETQGLRHGVFTYYYMDGLKGNADGNNDKIVTISELYSYVNNKVKIETANKQNPILRGNYDAKMPIGVIEN